VSPSVLTNAAAFSPCRGRVAHLENLALLAPSCARFANAIRQSSADEGRLACQRAHCQIEDETICVGVPSPKWKAVLCQNCVTHPINPGHRPSFRGTRQRVSMLREVVDRQCVGGIWYASARVKRTDFQACSIDHSDISPLWNQRFASGPEQCSAKKLLQSCGGEMRLLFSGLRAREKRTSRELS
jgi:hypothetical protein